MFAVAPLDTMMTFDDGVVELVMVIVSLGPTVPDSLVL